MCEICEFTDRVTKLNSKIEIARDRHSSQILEFGALIKEGRIKEAEDMRLSIHNQTDIILDAVVSIQHITKEVEAFVKKGMGH